MLKHLKFAQIVVACVIILETKSAKHFLLEMPRDSIDCVS
jgi:hypothetical protein